MTAAAANIVACPRCGKRNRVPAAAAGVPRCGNYNKPLPWIATADDESFAEVVDAARLPVVVDLWATWCAPCHVVSPALEQVARDLAGTVNSQRSTSTPRRRRPHALSYRRSRRCL